MRHQRPSSTKRGAASFHASGSSTAGRSYFTGLMQPARNGMARKALANGRHAARAILFMAVRGAVRSRDALVRDHARLLGLALDVGGRALLGQVAVAHQLEEHRHEEDRKE